MVVSQYLSKAIYLRVFVDVTSPLEAIVVKVEEDLHGSDHFPIILESHYHPPDDRPPQLQFHKAD